MRRWFSQDRLKEIVKAQELSRPRDDRFLTVPLRMWLSALKSNELPSVKSSKNVLSLENHYSVMQEQSLLQGQACITCEEVWESSLPVLSYFFSQLSPSITS